MQATQQQRNRMFIALVVTLLATMVAMYPTLNNGWVNYDDPEYVLNNELVYDLSAESVGAMFTSGQVMGLYHPLTLLSLAVDFNVWETDAFGYHFTNLFLHILNVALAFGLILLLSGRYEIAFVAALLFGVHPMHLESVAWISGRKDVLYTFFFLAGLIAYVFYIRNRSGKPWRWWSIALVLFVCSVLSKSMAVVFPAAMLLIDYLLQRTDWKRMALEKLPFLVLGVTAIIIGVYAQLDAAAMQDVQHYPYSKTVFTGSANYLQYVAKAIVPYSMAAFHPYPVMDINELPWQYYLAVLPVLLLLILVVKLWKRNRPLVFGIGFFSICIVLALQIVPMGRAMMADRYTYVAYIGLFYLIGHGLYALLNWARNKQLYTALTISGFSAFALLLAGWTFARADVWKNGQSLWEEVIDQYPDHYYGYASLGNFQLHSKQYQAAVSNYDKALAQWPEYAEGYLERGIANQELMRFEAAVADYTSVIQLMPEDARAWINRGIVRMQHLRDTAAHLDFFQATQLNPQDPIAWINYGVAQEIKGNFEGAIDAYSSWIELQPEVSTAYRYRGVANAAGGMLKQAEADITNALRLEPYNAEYYYLRGDYRLLLGDTASAMIDLKLAADGNSAEARERLQSVERSQTNK